MCFFVLFSITEFFSQVFLHSIFPVAIIRLTRISGGPTKCGHVELPNNFTCSTDEEISGSITLCGKPKPTISWMVGDQSFNGSVNTTKADQHQYTYFFKKTITSDMCGKYISYQATGFHNVSGSSLILLKECKFTILYLLL